MQAQRVAVKVVNRLDVNPQIGCFPSESPRPPGLPDCASRTMPVASSPALATMPVDHRILGNGVGERFSTLGILTPQEFLALYKISQPSQLPVAS